MMSALRVFCGTRGSSVFALALVSLVLVTASSAAEPAGDSVLTITAVGDVNLGTAYPSTEFLSPDDGASLLSPVAKLLEGDIVFGNLEGPLADGGTTEKCSSPRGCYAFRTPTSYVKSLKAAGFNVFSIANNHAMDFGEDGRLSTIKTLDAAGIAHSGPVGDLAEFDIKGSKVALLAFTTAEHSYNLLDIDAAAKAVADADSSHDIVIVSFHGGREGSHAQHVPYEMELLGTEPRGELRKFTHAVIDAGADLVLGHGPHVLRGLELYKRRLIAYSLGNFCTYARFNLSGPLGRAVVLSVDISITSGEFLGGRLRATLQVKPGGARPDPSDRGTKLVRELSHADFRYSAPGFADDGQLFAPEGDGAGLLGLTEPERARSLSKLLGYLKAAGIEEAKLRKWFGDRRARLLPEVMQRFSRPAEKLPYPRYRAIFVNPEVLAAGKKFLAERSKLLDSVERKYGVDRAVLAGLIATETRFGAHRGDFSTFNALATVFFDYDRRRSWGQQELLALLRVFPDDPLAVKGSYAGAIGLVQFMPSSIKTYGVDFDKDGKIDLDKWDDALASAANYLHRHGWKKGQPVRRGEPNYRAIYRYNPAHNYVRVVGELAAAFGLAKKDPKKAPKTAPEKEKSKQVK